MRRLPALVAALLLPAAQPLLLGTALSTASLLVSEAPAQAQSAEAVGKVAQAITVRIEGATQGSGVLVKRDGNRYTVLTAWHVVSGQRPGEELEVVTPDGQRHQLEQGSIKRLGQVDMAVLTFSSSTAYEVARVGDVKSVSMGSPIFVAGFPLPSSSVSTRLLRLIKGDVIANASVAIPDGYQLLYDNQTLPGVSGGAVLNAKGELVGIHGKAERADQVSESSGKAVATGTNQGVPISYYKQYAAGEAVVASTTQATRADDYLAQATLILEKLLPVGRESEGEFLKVIKLTTEALNLSPNNSTAYALRARARVGIGRNKEAVDDASRAIAVNPSSWNALFARAGAKSALGDKQGAIADYDEAIMINPLSAASLYNRGNAKYSLGDKQGAIADYGRALDINPKFAAAYTRRGIVRSDLGDNQGAIADFTQAIAINPQYANAWGARGLAKSQLGDRFGACEDMRKSASLGFTYAQSLLPQMCQ